MKRPLVLVSWFDIVGIESWQGEEDRKDWLPQECITVGYLFEKTKDLTILVSTISPNAETDKFSSVTIIPTGCVRKITKIKEGK